MVGALLCEPVDPTCACGVIFFNNVGYLGMCGHGTIGLVATLSYMGKVAPGRCRIETPVGTVSATLNADGSVSVQNVASYRLRAGVMVDVPKYGQVTGDIAWGGNWFFLIADHDKRVELSCLDELIEFTWAIRQALTASGITGKDGQEIDHIAPSEMSNADSRNFVLCPGKAYDRSPCGTGTSAKLACLYADGKLQPTEIWRQESIVGSVFEGAVSIADGLVMPTITGTAFVNSEADLLLDPDDPFCMGIRR
jgi:4-hydroxyproline epimerase